MVLVELGVVEQRYQAVLEVLGGASVADVARRYGVVRQTVHRWLVKYAESGVSGLADRSSRPHSCPHQMPPVIEARVIEMRRAHPGWGSGAVAVSVWDSSGVAAPQAGRCEEAAEASFGVSAVGTVTVDGVVADGCDGSRQTRRRQ